MAFNKLSNLDKANKEEFIKSLLEAKAKVEEAISDFNKEQHKAWEKVNDSVLAYNELVEKAESYRSDIAGQQEDHYYEKSERWQEGERGEQYSSWKDEWAETLDEIDFEAPDDVEVPDMEHADVLENLKDKP